LASGTGEGYNAHVLALADAWPPSAACLRSLRAEDRSMSHDVFISYAMPDKHTADAACALLEQRGIRVWIAPRDIVPGSHWAESVVEAIESSRVMVIVFSSHANHSTQIAREVERAAHHGIPLLPVRIEDATPSKSLEYFISARHWLDAMTPPLERHLERLAETIRRILDDGQRDLPSDASVSFSAKAPPAPARSRRALALAAALATVAAIVAWRWQRDEGTSQQAEPVTQHAVAPDRAASAEELAAQALRLIQRGEIMRGKEVATRAVALDPKSAPAYAARALASVFNSELESAEDDANHALTLDPESSVAYVARGGVWATKGEMEIAAKDLDDAVRLDSDSGLPHLFRGFLCYLQGKLPEALADFHLAMTTSWRPMALVDRSLTNLRMGEIDRAIADADEAIALAPKLQTAYVARSMAHARAGQTERALSDAGDAIRMNPEESSAYAVRALARLELGHLVEAAADANEALRRMERSPVDPQLASMVFTMSSYVYRANHEWEKALELAKKAVDSGPLSSETYFARGMAHLRWSAGWTVESQDLPAAVADLATAARLAPNDGYCWYWLAFAQYNQHAAEQYAEALASINRAIEANNVTDLSPRTIQIVCLGRLERWDDIAASADAALQEAGREDGGPEIVKYWQGRAAYARGDYQRAVADLASALEAEPGEAHYWLARAHAAVGEFDAAVASLEQALQLGAADEFSDARQLLDDFRSKSATAAGADESVAQE